jgi:hypothetical protein
MINAKSYSQVQRSVTIDVNDVRLNLQVTLEQVAHYIVVSKSRTEVQRDMVFIVLSVHCHWWKSTDMSCGIHSFLPFICTQSYTLPTCPRYSWKLPVTVYNRGRLSATNVKSYTSILLSIILSSRLSFSAYKFYGLQLIKFVLQWCSHTRIPVVSFPLVSIPNWPPFSSDWCSIKLWKVLDCWEGQWT